MSYWHRTGPSTFTPSRHVGGAWDLETQHIATLLGVLAHEVEREHDARRGAGGLRISRLSYDILGTIPLEPVAVEITVLRRGRTIELVEARASHAGRPVVLLRAWLTAGYATADLEGTHHVAMPAPDEVPAWDMTTLWAGGFIASVEVRRRDLDPGRAQAWVRTPHALVADEGVSRLAQVAGLLDITNGIAVRVDPKDVSFPNLDLTAHLFRAPAPGWLGLDTTVSFGPEGAGVTTSVLHDERGPFGISTQCLTVRP
ncbi:thioesterase family protein [Nocardioides sp.]|uniref:thioesterase family protein n=1 Tax=Nocardioides sp. TaxID=35761 RepID=UPI00198315D5|nr:thioesterase family protein [Nocardioides sp.]MBC7276696.1 thioesterase family protein [Nocardioides sp.]